MDTHVIGHDGLINELPKASSAEAKDECMPVYEAFRIDEKKVTFFCPVCNRSHFHKGKGNILRCASAHCKSERSAEFLNTNGYFLVVRNCEFVVHNESVGYFFLVPDAMDGGFEWVNSLQLATRFPSVDAAQEMLESYLEHCGTCSDDEDDTHYYVAHKELSESIKGATVKMVAVQPRVVTLKAAPIKLDIPPEYLDTEGIFSDTDDDEDEDEENED